MGAKAEGLCACPEFYEEMVMQFGSHELDDLMAALANLKQTLTVSEYYKSFIKLAHLVDDSENLIRLFLSRLREDLRGKMKLDRPMSIVSAYKSAWSESS